MEDAAEKWRGVFWVAVSRCTYSASLWRGLCVNLNSDRRKLKEKNIYNKDTQNY